MALPVAKSRLAAKPLVAKPNVDCTRFHTKSSVLLRRIKNKNIEAKTQKLIVETLGPLQGKHEVFKDGAIKWRLPLLKSMELEMYV